MTDKASHVGETPPELPTPQNTITWCKGHWAQLMFALQDRGLSSQISDSDEALTAKFIAGERDPCYEAFNRINVAALEVFGIDKIINQFHGCPACAFANIIDHVADIVRIEEGGSH